MAAELFVDTSAWYPAIVSTHADHQRVATALTDRVRRKYRIVTTNLVVAETHALLLYRVHRHAALRFVTTVRQTPNVIVTSDPELEERAVSQWLAKYGDQNFSMCDAVGFAVMSTRRISEALTLDRHFGTAGFQVVP